MTKKNRILPGHLNTALIKDRYLRFWIFTAMVLFACSCKTGSQQAKSAAGFQPIFNGKNLDGWIGDPIYWKVENGILVGEVTPETILNRNTFIIYEKDQPSDFELKLEYKISEMGNSGVNYRSEKINDLPFALRGYQCDIDGRNRYTGQNYEERKRTTLAYMSEKVTIPKMPDSIPQDDIRKNVKKNSWQTRDVIGSFGDKEQLKTNIKANDWNTVHIIAKGPKMQHFVNGTLISEVTDLDTINQNLTGYIGVQVHVGPPMKVEFKEIRLKIL
ncbi:MAG: DUF1080 domain-containing protein [Leeuwenhoekiella sp.]